MSSLIVGSGKGRSRKGMVVHGSTNNSVLYFDQYNFSEEE